MIPFPNADNLGTARRDLHLIKTTRRSSTRTAVLLCDKVSHFNA
jgi:hypothetical protein